MIRFSFSLCYSHFRTALATDWGGKQGTFFLDTPILTFAPFPMDEKINPLMNMHGGFAIRFVLLRPLRCAGRMVMVMMMR